MNKRTPLIAGNWKMNGTLVTAEALLSSIQQNASSVTNVDLAVFPPYVFLPKCQQILLNSSVLWGGQNVAIEPEGAFTGEISAGMLRDFGCHYTLVGHSERRALFGETNEIVAAKYKAAQQSGLIPIICVGETLQERKKGLTYAILRAQLDTIFSLPEAMTALRNAVIAYEPVWAIGTGLTAEPDTAQEVHATIRQWVAEYDKEVAAGIQILYGGSVKPDNAAALFAMPDIDGGLIGGASLDAKNFLDIARSCSSL